MPTPRLWLPGSDPEGGQQNGKGQCLQHNDSLSFGPHKPLEGIKDRGTVTVTHELISLRPLFVGSRTIGFQEGTLVA